MPSPKYVAVAAKLIAIVLLSFIITTLLSVINHLNVVEWVCTDCWMAGEARRVYVSVCMFTSQLYRMLGGSNLFATAVFITRTVKISGYCIVK